MAGAGADKPPTMPLLRQRGRNPKSSKAAAGSLGRPVTDTVEAQAFRRCEHGHGGAQWIFSTWLVDSDDQDPAPSTIGTCY